MSSNLSQLYRDLTALRHIQRFQQHACVRSISVAEHSFFVALLAAEFAHELEAQGISVNPYQVVVTALYHDAAEAGLGDLPHPVKRIFPNLAHEWDEAEEATMQRIPSAVVATDLAPPGSLEAWLVKVADGIELVLYVAEEQVSGNHALDYAQDKIVALLTSDTMRQASKSHHLEVWYAGVLSSLPPLTCDPGRRLAFWPSVIPGGR